MNTAAKMQADLQLLYVVAVAKRDLEISQPVILAGSQLGLFIFFGSLPAPITAPAFAHQNDNGNILLKRKSKLEKY